MSRTSPLLLLCSTALTIGCGDGATDPQDDALIQVLEGDGGSDSALAVVAAPLVVRVRDANLRPMAGARVRFRALPPASADDDDVRRGMYVCATDKVKCATWFDDGNYELTFGAEATTDDAGLARARVQHGVLAGPASIEISVADVGTRLVDFTTRPASLAQVIATVADTAVYVGASYLLVARAADRFGNMRSEPVTLTSGTPSVATVAAGRVTAIAVGRGQLLMAAGTISGRAFVSVPPPGRLAAFGGVEGNSISLRRLTLVDTDGSSRRVVILTPGDNGNANPAWTPDGSRLVFQESLDGYRGPLQLTDTLGTRSAILTDVAWSTQPAFSGDGTGLYFFGPAAALPDGIHPDGIYRANADGTGARYLFTGAQPGPSPDGTRVAYLVTSFLSPLRVRDVTTSGTTVLAPSAQLPRWSPAGDLIAFVTYDGRSEVQVVQPDGANRRTVGPGFHDFGVSWSPDGAWLVVARYGGGLELIRVADGLVIPIPGTKDLTQPAWRP